MKSMQQLLDEEKTEMFEKLINLEIEKLKNNSFAKNRRNKKYINL